MVSARKGIYDLHVHSYYSDGDLSPAEVVRALADIGAGGIGLADHNGLWGVEEGGSAARKVKIEFVQGIEISARFAGIDAHILGYSLDFDHEVMIGGLKKTRQGYMDRISKMVELCQEQGYDRISVESLKRKKGNIKDPIVMSYDLGRALTEEYGLSIAEARALTVDGGACHVPYGDWALSIKGAVDLIHKARGAAVFAHPGVGWRDQGQKTFMRVWHEALAAGIDGLEAYHTYHDSAMVKKLLALAKKDQLLVTGGSDWHGPGRYKEMDRALGKVGVEEKEYRALLNKLGG